MDKSPHLDKVSSIEGVVVTYFVIFSINDHFFLIIKNSAGLSKNGWKWLKIWDFFKTDFRLDSKSKSKITN